MVLRERVGTHAEAGAGRLGVGGGDGGGGRRRARGGRPRQRDLVLGAHAAHAAAHAALHSACAHHATVTRTHHHLTRGKCLCQN